MTDNNKHKTDGNNGWEDAWKDKLQEIDRQIMDFAKDADKQSAEMLDNLGEKISDWFESQPMSERAKAEWKKARADGKVVRAKVEQRLTHLIEDGRVKMKNVTGSSGS